MLEPLDRRRLYSGMRQTLTSLRKWLNERVVLGAQLYVSIAARPMLEFADGCAFSPDVPVCKSTLFPWLCAVKPVTAVILAQLMEQSKLDIDEPITAWVEMPNGPRAPSIRDLMMHRTTLPDCRPPLYPYLASRRAIVDSILMTMRH